MARLLQTVCFVSILTLASSNRLESLQKKYTELVIECAKDYPITPEDVEQLQRKEIPDKEAVKCLFACAYKKAGMMDDEGKMSVERTHEIIHKYLDDDPDTMKKAIDFTNACSSVNDETVSDGDKGCDRAALIFRCSVEKADEVCDLLFRPYFVRHRVIKYSCWLKKKQINIYR